MFRFFVPAFTDSELGIDFALYQRQRKKEGKPPLRFDPYLDFEHYASTMLATKRMGIFTIGGGVPRNWAQQFGVYAELLARRGYEKIPLKRYNYGLRICPEPVNWGRPIRQHIYRSRFLGEVCASRRRRQICGGARRRDRGAAAYRWRCPGTNRLPKSRPILRNNTLRLEKTITSLFGWRESMTRAPEAGN
jgi:hypothetical protein